MKLICDAAEDEGYEEFLLTEIELIIARNFLCVCGYDWQSLAELFRMNANHVYLSNDFAPIKESGEVMRLGNGKKSIGFSPLHEFGVEKKREAYLYLSCIPLGHIKTEEEERKILKAMALEKYGPLFRSTCFLEIAHKKGEQTKYSQLVSYKK